MFTHRRAPFGTAKILALLHVFLACVSSPLATSDDRSVLNAGRRGSPGRSPNLLFKVPEGSSHVRSSEPQGVIRRRSFHREMNDEDYVPRKMPASSRPRADHKGTNVYENVITSYNSTKNDVRSRKKIDDSERKLVDNSRVNKLEVKLYSCVIFRANMIAVFGQILKAPNNRLTVDQYSSLNLIQQALIHNQVHTLNMLPILKRLQNADKKGQFKLVIRALVNNVPVYMASACKFWVKQIKRDHVDIEAITAASDQSADFLAGLDSQVIDTCKVKVSAEGLEPYDEALEVTMNTLGPAFVNIFNKFKNHQIALTPTFFGAILINLPIGKLNPLLEEYINYVWDVMQTSAPYDWNEVASGIEYGSPYDVVKSVVKRLISKGDDTPDVLKRALKYILLHLKEVPSTVSDTCYADMGMLSNNGRNSELVLSMIQDDVAIPEFCELRDRVIVYIEQMNADDILKGMNKYTYQKPIDMVIALLARIQVRTQEKDIRETVTKLLSVLIYKKEVASFRPTISADVDLPLLFDLLDVPDSDPEIPALGKKIQQYLDGNLDLLISLQKLLLEGNKAECQRPIQCLLQLFEKAVDSDPIPGLEMTPDFIIMIRQLMGLIKSTFNDSAKCKSYDEVSVGSTETPDDLNDDQFSLGSTVSPVPITSSAPIELSDAVLHLNDKVDDPTPSPSTLSDKDASFPDGSIEIAVHVPAELPIPNPQPKPKPQPQTKPKPVPKPILTIKPPPAFLWIKPPLSTRPSSPPTKKPPAEHEPNSLSPQDENEPFLPPNLSYDRPMYVVFPEDDGPPYTSPTKPSGLEIVVEFASIEILLRGFDPKTPFSSNELLDVAKILGPLERSIGPNFIEEILGKSVDKSKYPTAISLMDDLLDHALESPKVTADPELLLSVQWYLKGLDYISTAALFLVIIDSQKILSDVLYVTFDPDHPSTNSVDSEPPFRTLAGLVTVSLYHPKFWVQQVDPLDPYGTLLPSVNGGEDNPIQVLIDEGSLQEILGPDFYPLLYSNKGTLLTTVLQKLIVSEHVNSDPWLLNKLYAYLQSIRTVAMYNRLPSNYITHLLQLHETNKVNWQPDTANLIVALPPARNQDELDKINLIHDFLKTPNLLKLLGIKYVSYSFTRGALLKMIFAAAIRGDKVALGSKTLAALKYYEGKILISGLGALPVVWFWVQMYVISEDVPIGRIIDAVIDYDSLPRWLQISYNVLIDYLSDNPKFLQANDDFPLERYHTKGAFLEGLFTYLLKKTGMSPQARLLIKQLIPYIKLEGSGSAPMDHVTADDITNEEIVKTGTSALMND